MQRLLGKQTGRLTADRACGRVHAARGLARRGDERIAATLVDLADYDDPRGDIHGHVRAAEVLSCLPRHREKAAEALTRIATDSTHWDALARVEAAEFLAWLDGYRAPGTELLARLANDKSSRHHARKALAELHARRHPTAGASRARRQRDHRVRDPAAADVDHLFSRLDHGPGYHKGRRDAAMTTGRTNENPNYFAAWVNRH
ncbi:hypothetical protein ACIPSA_42110 [Streptomyces sp. NPDC086549]|uniref:hypothetical protein n=1 Tax=Streptomyces sp. NPDC086549 TaxID=3365752 RepID=UPI00382C1FE2